MIHQKNFTDITFSSKLGNKMEASAAMSSLYYSSHRFNRTNSCALQITCMATQKPKSSSTTKTTGSKKGTVMFPVGEPGPRYSTQSNGSVKLLTRVEQLRLLTKAEKAGLLSAAEKFGLSLTSIEELGLLSKAEELGVLSAATDPGTPSTLLTLSLGLLILGPVFVYLVPEDSTWEVAVQVLVALVSVVGGSAAFAASSLVSNLQKLD